MSLEPQPNALHGQLRARMKGAWKEWGWGGQQLGDRECTPCIAKSGIHSPRIFMHTNITGVGDALVPAPTPNGQMSSAISQPVHPFLGHLGPPSGGSSATQWLEDPQDLSPWAERWQCPAALGEAGPQANDQVETWMPHSPRPHPS